MESLSGRVECLSSEVEERRFVAARKTRMTIVTTMFPSTRKTPALTLKQFQSIESHALGSAPAHRFSLIGDGACPWQPAVMLFERMSHFNAFCFPGILSRLHRSLSRRRMSEWHATLARLGCITARVFGRHRIHICGHTDGGRNN